MQYAKFALLFALLVAMGCSDRNPVTAQDEEPGNGMVSLTGSFSGSNHVGSATSILEECAGALTSLNLEGNGQFTQIGLATVAQAHCAQPEPFSFNPDKVEVLYGKIAITGANGDEIYADYWGTMIYSDKTVLEGEFTVTGGAGRFDGAYGDGSFVGELTGPDNELTAELNGEISPPRL